MLQKILILGCAGAGKSTFATELGQKLGIEVIYLDSLFWLPGWVATPRPVWREKVTALCQKERWIMDGNYNNTLQLRLQYADAVVYFDFPRLKCLWGAVKRRIIYSGKTRPDMGAGCNEKLDVEFVKFIWNFNKTEKPQALKLLGEFKGPVIMLKNRRAAAELIQSGRLSADAANGEI
jgi:adenylate kinase family enzyme